MRKRTIPGSSPHRNERVIYIEMLRKEKVTRLFKTIGEHTHAAHRRGFLGYGFTNNCILTLPTGQRLIATSCSRYPVTVNERDKDFSTELDFSVDILRQFADATHRLWATIHDSSGELTLQLSSGRTFPLDACKARPMGRKD